MRPVLVSLIFALSAALSSWLVVVAVDARVDEAHPTIGLDAWAGIVPRIEALEADPREPRAMRVVFLGDSTTFISTGPPIPDLLERALRAPRRDRETQVRSLGFSGMNPFDYYYLSEPIRRTDADRIVMNVNLAVFSEPSRAYYSRPELAGWIPPRRWAQAALLPLHWQGLTFDELILRSAVVELGLWELWYAFVRQGVRLEKAYQDLSVRAQGRKQSFRGPFTQQMLWILAENGRLTTPNGPEELRVRYGVALDGVAPDHPILHLLGAAVAEYVASGIAVTVYVGPIDLDAIDREGLSDGPGLGESIERIGAAVEAAGGHFVDLHDLLPSAAFRDPAGHLAGKGPVRVARALARAIETHPVPKLPPPIRP